MFDQLYRTYVSLKGNLNILLSDKVKFSAFITFFSIDPKGSSFLN
jgi:hypothetical protein